MQKAKKQIPLYKIRSFGENFTATFDFIRSNFKLWFKGCIYLLLPLSLVQAFLLNGFFSFIFEIGLNAGYGAGMPYSSIIRTVVYYLLYFIFMMLGALVLSSFCYAMVKHYSDNDGQMEGIGLRELKPFIIGAAKRSLALGALFFGVTILITILLVLAVYIAPTLLMLISIMMIGLIVFLVPLSISLPIYIFEDEISLIDSIKRSFKLGFNHFGLILGFIIVMSMVSSIIQSTVMMPWYIMILVKTFLLVDDPTNSVVGSPLYSFGVYLLAIVQSLGTYMSMALPTIGQAYVYGSIVEKDEKRSVEKDIEHFEEMSQVDNEFDNFENL